MARRLRIVARRLRARAEPPRRVHERQRRPPAAPRAPVGRAPHAVGLERVGPPRRERVGLRELRGRGLLRAEELLMKTGRWTRRAALFGATLCLIAACVATGPEAMKQHLWWSGLGPVLPHDTFPADCALCHVGNDWQTLTADFRFD